MVEKVNPSINRPASAFKTAGALAYAGSKDGFIVESGSPTSIAIEDADITEGNLNAFSETSSGSSLDVTIDAGEAFVFGSWVCIDSSTTVTLDASTTGQVVYLGWDKGTPDAVIIGLSSAFSSASGDTDQKIPLWEFDTDSSGVTAVTDSRNFNQLDADALNGADSSEFIKTTDPIDADTLDGLDSSEFIKTTDPIDADTLDGADSSEFIKTTDTIDADTLDGLDSTELGSTISTIYSSEGTALESSIPSQDSSPEGIAWNDDGTKLYEVGSGSNNIYESDVSTPYDISTATFSTSISAPQGEPNDITFNGDGSKLYVISTLSSGPNDETIYEYDLTTPYDISTASQTQSIGAYSDSPEGMAWNNFGTQVYESEGGTIYSSPVETPYDISTKRNGGSRIDMPDDFVSSGLTFNGDGTAVIVGVNQYTLSTPYDLTTATSDKVYSGYNGDSQIHFFNDGLTFAYLSDLNTVAVKTLSTPYDIDSETSEVVFSSMQAGAATGFTLTPDGTELITFESFGDIRYIYTLSTPFDVSTATVDDQGGYLGSLDTQTGDTPYSTCKFSSDGMVLYEIDNSPNIYEHTLSEPFDLRTSEKGRYFSETINLTGELLVILSGNPPYDIAFDDDANDFYISSKSDADGSKIVKLRLAESDVLESYFPESLNSQGSGGITWNDTGTKLYETGSNSIYEYAAPSPFDITTASFLNSYSTQGSSTADLLWNDDGTKLYELSGSTIYESSVGTDIITDLSIGSGIDVVKNGDGDYTLFFDLDDDEALPFGDSNDVSLRFDPETGNLVWRNEENLSDTMSLDKDNGNLQLGGELTENSSI